MMRTAAAPSPISTVHTNTHFHNRFGIAMKNRRAGIIAIDRNWHHSAAPDPALSILDAIVARMSESVNFRERERIKQRVPGASHIYTNCVIRSRDVSMIQLLFWYVPLKIIGFALRDGGARKGILLG